MTCARSPRGSRKTATLFLIHPALLFLLPHSLARKSDVRPPPRPSRTAARELRLHAGESRLGEAGDRQISGGPAGLGRDPDPLACPGAARRLDAAPRHRT